jgi:hypothetical protein
LKTEPLPPGFVKDAMRKYLPALVVCALVAPAALSAVSTVFDDTEHISQTIRLEPGGTVRLKSFSGRVTITPSDRAEVVVDAVRRASRDRLDRIKLDVHADGANVVVIDANRRERGWFDMLGRNTVVETDFDIKVPRRTNLDISVFSAPVSIDGVEGSHRVNSFSSRLTVINATGSIRAHTFSGPVEIREKTWEADHTIDVDTFSGNVELHVPDSARGSLAFNSFSGRLNSEVPLTFHGTSRRALRAELGGGGDSRLRFHTFSGSVRIDR